MNRCSIITSNYVENSMNRCIPLWRDVQWCERRTSSLTSSEAVYSIRRTRYLDLLTGYLHTDLTGYFTNRLNAVVFGDFALVVKAKYFDFSFLIRFTWCLLAHNVFLPSTAPLSPNHDPITVGNGHKVLGLSIGNAAVNIRRPAFTWSIPFTGGMLPLP